MNDVDPHFTPIAVEYPAPPAPQTTTTTERAVVAAPTTSTTVATAHGMPVTGGDVLALTCLGFALLAAGLFTMLVRRARAW